MVLYSPPPKLTARERRFLRLLEPPGASISVGLEVGATMSPYGYVSLNRDNRYILTDAGRDAIRTVPRPARRSQAQT